MQDPKLILSTRPVEEALKNKAAARGIQLEAFSFIETTPVLSVEVQQEIELAATELATVVFTSMNAVESVTGLLDGDKPEWRVYCMGHKTRELAAGYFGEQAIAGVGDNAGMLADEIIEAEDIDEVIFFCGNHRRDELPAKLSANGIAVNEITVYETITTPHRVDKAFDAVLFFSPSAVESFFIKNKLPATAVVFAIGITTAETIKRFCGNKVIIAASPGKSQLVEQAIQYFNEPGPRA